MTYSCRGFPDKIDSSNKHAAASQKYVADVSKERMDLEHGI